MSQTSVPRSRPSRRLVRLLIVEDSRPDAELEIATLKRAGYSLSFDVVNCPDRFREQLKQGDYDVILCAHNLGDWTGADALDLLRQSGKDVPFIVATAALGDEAAVDYIKHGATDYILKHRLERLPVALGRALREKAHRDEAQRLEELIVCAKKEWELTFDTVPDPVFLLDAQCEIRKANRAAAEAFGLKFAEIIGRHWCEALNPAARHGPDCPLMRALDFPHAGPFEIKVPHVDRTYETNAKSVCDTTGAQNGFVCVMHDITGRKQAQDAMRESEERFRELFEDAPIAYHEIDQDGILRRVNRAECQLLGCQAHELLGRPVWEFVAPEFREISREAVCCKMTGQRALSPFECEYLRSDGTRLTLEIHEKLILGEHGSVTGIRSALLDVSERKRAEENNLRNEQFLSSVFASIQDGLCVLDRDFSIVRVNPTVEATFAGQMPLLGKKCFQVLRGQTEPCSVCPARQTLEANEAASAVVFREAGGGQPSAWIELRTFPLIDAVTGEARGVIEHIRDISAQRRLEEQLRQAQKMEAIGRLAGGVAHDFNNLLMIIQGYGELLLEKLEAARERHAAEEIVAASRRATALTRQLLAFSRKQVLQPQVLDLNAVVANVEKMLRRLIGEDIELLTRLDPELGTIRADPGQIEQVLMNLAVNARDAMPGGGQFTIETANVELDQDYASRHASVAAGRYVRLAVSDTGCGVDPETQGHLFEPFFTTKERGKGTGLGLATVYGIVEQSGGNIWVYSEVGRGTVFKIHLPRIEAPRPALREQDVRQEAVRGCETVLVAEDDDKVRALVCETLHARGYTVLEARDGEEALRIARSRKTPIHLLITDVIMPRMNGRKLAERLGALRPEIRLLYMSGYTDDTIVNHGVLEAGIAFLQKPFTAEALSVKVREALGSQATTPEEGNGETADSALKAPATQKASAGS